MHMDFCVRLFPADQFNIYIQKLPKKPIAIYIIIQEIKVLICMHYIQHNRIKVSVSRKLKMEIHT